MEHAKSGATGAAAAAASFDPPAEAELLRRARRMDPDAIRQLIQRHNQQLYRIARGILRSENEAEDVLQEAYCRGFTHLDSFRGDARFGTWLARIVMNEALGVLRRRRPTVTLEDIHEHPRLAAQVIPFPNSAPQLNPETTMAQNEIHSLLENAIDTLPAAFRIVLVARLIQGLSVEETAELFGILPETVKTRLHRARRLLRHEMEKHVGAALGSTFPFAGQRCERLTQRVLERLLRG